MKRAVKRRNREIRKENRVLNKEVGRLAFELATERSERERLQKHPGIHYFGTQVCLDRRNLGVLDLDELSNMLQNQLAANIAQHVVQNSLLRYEAVSDANLDIRVSAVIGVADLRDKAKSNIQDALRTIPHLEQIQEHMKTYGG